jgi:hypothetical protein
MLMTEMHFLVLSQPCPEFLTLDFAQEDKLWYVRWQKSNEIAKCYILIFVSDGLQHEMHDFWLASNILATLNEKFGEECRVTKQDMTNSLIDIRMAKGTPICDHYQDMLAYLKELEVLGMKIECQS